MNRDSQEMPEAVSLRQGNKPFQSGETSHFDRKGHKPFQSGETSRFNREIQAVLFGRGSKPFRWEEIREINGYPVISA
jgi:hypothetical protein